MWFHDNTAVWPSADTVSKHHVREVAFTPAGEPFRHVSSSSSLEDKSLFQTGIGLVFLRAKPMMAALCLRHEGHASNSRKQHPVLHQAQLVPDGRASPKGTASVAALVLQSLVQV